RLKREIRSARIKPVWSTVLLFDYLIDFGTQPRGEKNLEHPDGWILRGVGKAFDDSHAPSSVLYGYAYPQPAGPTQYERYFRSYFQSVRPDVRARLMALTPESIRDEFSLWLAPE
ncbi:MAG TPA: hypothetical protein PKC28_11045, partial [Bdellovibrionales bacterium]|nr:hypothetical protein [Bdellovibrionales bacterium]